jgi:hypothetical protein
MRAWLYYSTLKKGARRFFETSANFYGLYIVRHQNIILLVFCFGPKRLFRLYSPRILHFSEIGNPTYNPWSEEEWKILYTFVTGRISDYTPNVRFVVLTAVLGLRSSAMPCSSVNINIYVGSDAIFSEEVVENGFFRNIGTHAPNYMGICSRA